MDFLIPATWNTCRCPLRVASITYSSNIFELLAEIKFIMFEKKKLK